MVLMLSKEVSQTLLQFFIIIIFILFYFYFILFLFLFFLNFLTRTSSSLLDFRVAKDNIGVVMHSSPVEFYESLNCRGKYVEDMTSEECTQCQMEITQYHFLSVPQLLSWAENKINVMFCVKESKDIPRAITTLLENNASHRAFLELHTDDFLALEGNQTPSWDQVYYVVELKSHDDYDR